MPDLYLSATADSTGRAVAQVRPRGADRWIVRQVSPSMAVPAATTIGYLAKNGFQIAPFVPGGDAVGDEPPVELQAADVLEIVWEQATPGAIGRAWVSYELGR